MPLLLPVLTLLLAISSTAPAQSQAAWPHWRGPDRTGVSKDNNWATEGKEKPLWTKELGLGYSSVAIAEGRLYTLGFDSDKGIDKLFCLDEKTGRELWLYSWPADIRANFHGGGTLTTPTLDGNVVYVTNREGRCHAIEAETGKLIWEHKYAEELELKVTFHGYSASPLALEDRLILLFGNNLLSVNKADGEITWRRIKPGDGGYSNPIPFTLRGRRQLAIFGGEGLSVFDTETGKERYHYPWKPKGGGVNAATPIILGKDKIFISTAYDMGSALLQLGEDHKPELLWRARRMRNKCSSCVLYKDHIYGFDESILTCIDLKGKRKWRKRGLGMGAVSIAGDRLIVLSSKGEVLIGKASPEGFTPDLRQKILKGGVYWTSPVYLNGFLYCRNSLGTLVCLDHRVRDGVGSTTQVTSTETSASNLPKAEDLFARHANMIGAEDLMEVRSATFKGTVEIRDVGLTPSPLMIQLGAAHDRILTIDHGTYGRGRYGFDAEIAWELDSLFFERVMDSTVHRELLETQSLAAMAVWQDSYPRRKTSGKKHFAGSDCWVVTTTSKAGAARTLYFNCESGALAGHEAEGEALVTYADWKLFGEIMVATTITLTAHDTGNEELRKITEVVWGNVSKTTFARPEAVTRMRRTPAEIAIADEAAKKLYLALLGHYTQINSTDGRTRKTEMTVSDGFLCFKPMRGGSLWFLPPDAKGVFAGRDRPFKLSFEKDKDGKVTGMTMKTRSRTYSFGRDQ